MYADLVDSELATLINYDSSSDDGDDDDDDDDVVLPPSTCTENPKASKGVQVNSTTSVERSSTGSLHSTILPTVTLARTTAAIDSRQHGCSVSNACTQTAGRGNVPVGNSEKLAFVKTSGNVYKVVDINNQQLGALLRPRPPTNNENSSSVLVQRSFNSKITTPRKQFNRGPRIATKSSDVSTTTTFSKMSQRMSQAFQGLHIIPFDPSMAKKKTARNQQRPTLELRHSVRENSSMTVAHRKALLPGTRARQKCNGESSTTCNATLVTTQSENALIAASSVESQTRSHEHQSRPLRQNKRNLWRPASLKMNSSKMTNQTAESSAFSSDLKNLQLRGGTWQCQSDPNVGEINITETRRGPTIVLPEHTEHTAAVKRTNERTAEQTLADRKACDEGNTHEGNSKSSKLIVCKRRYAGMSGRPSNALQAVAAARSSATRTFIPDTRFGAAAKLTDGADMRRVDESMIGEKIKTTPAIYQKPCIGTMTLRQRERDPTKHPGQQVQLCSNKLVGAELRHRTQHRVSYDLPVVGQRMEVCLNVKDTAATRRRINPELRVGNSSSTKASTMTSSAVTSSISVDHSPACVQHCDVALLNRPSLSEIKSTLATTAENITAAATTLTRKQRGTKHPTTDVVSLVAGSTRCTMSMSIKQDVAIRRKKSAAFDKLLTVKSKNRGKQVSPRTTTKNTSAPSTSNAAGHRTSHDVLDDHRQTTSPDIVMADRSVSDFTPAVRQPTPLLRELVLALDVQVDMCCERQPAAIDSARAPEDVVLKTNAVEDESTRLNVARVEAWIDDVNRCRHSDGVDVGDVSQIDGRQQRCVRSLRSRTFGVTEQLETVRRGLSAAPAGERSVLGLGDDSRRTIASNDTACNTSTSTVTRTKLRLGRTR